MCLPAHDSQNDSDKNGDHSSNDEDDLENEGDNHYDHFNIDEHDSDKSSENNANHLDIGGDEFYNHNNDRCCRKKRR